MINSIAMATDQTTSQLIAGIAVAGTGDDWFIFPLVFAIGAITFIARYWRFFTQWLNGVRGRDWTTVSAVVDVVSVVKQTEETRYGERTIGYLATLTYFYRNPELQSGEYSRMFDTETDAQAWVASHKGSNVMVHVDPRDLSHSVLRKEEL